jgi:2-polyprenyl-3-methyl-5-hydroxy-6-metoxy-1,4-benzoquinol methylase
MQQVTDASAYEWRSAELNSSHEYLLPALTEVLERPQLASLPRRLFDLGCGNGATANYLAGRGWDIAGVDPSVQGIAQANRTFPSLRLERGAAGEDLAARFGTYPFVISMEVVEHVYAPREYARTLHSLVQPGGVAVVSTPYHGYWKNLAIALSGRSDRHYDPLWDHGHIKFWSAKTLTALLEQAGFRAVEIRRLGRIAPLAKSMLAIARRP